MIIMLLGAPFAFAISSVLLNATDQRRMLPMRQVGGGVGTGENECDAKDASAFRVKPHPEGGFVDFPVPVGHWIEHGGEVFVTVRAEVHAPDSLANSFWVQLDGGSAFIWNLEVSGDDWIWTDIKFGGGREKEECMVFQSNSEHHLRLFVREPGAVVRRLNFSVPKPLEMISWGGCPSAGCESEGGDLIEYRVKNFCGPGTMGNHHLAIHTRELSECIHRRLVTSNGTIGIQCTTTKTYVSGETEMIIDYLGQRLSVPIRFRASSSSGMHAWYFILGAGILLVVAFSAVFLVGARLRDPGVIQAVGVPVTGEVTLVAALCDAHRILRSKLSDEEYRAYQEKYAQVFAKTARSFGGFINGNVTAFSTARSAVSFAMEVQKGLVGTAWPEHLYDDQACSEVDVGGRRLWGGPRVRMSVHTGEPTVKRSKQVTYEGPVRETLFHIVELADGGEVLISPACARLLYQELSVDSIPVGDSYSVDPFRSSNQLGESEGTTVRSDPSGMGKIFDLPPLGWSGIKEAGQRASGSFKAPLRVLRFVTMDLAERFNDKSLFRYVKRDDLVLSPQCASIRVSMTSPRPGGLGTSRTDNPLVPSFKMTPPA
eukprot:Hpha_TRINITY_DN13068_c0_g1::TRINITY_DN13068_c0_g1_i1::g.68963::m.68963